MEHFEFVGETLRRIRKEKGKTLEKLGREAGLGRGQLSRIENNYQAATLGTLDKILTSQGLTRREFFRRYDQVEAEMLANRRAESPAESVSGRWPEEIQNLVEKVETFVQGNLLQPRPIAQGVFEMGEWVVLFRVVPRSAPEAQGAGSPSEELPPAPAKRRKRKD
ncbi:MAG TPA: helix-turn-helix transcriptional regulator [Thermoanaerobaculia bacterium]|nr:helix-turn-helix transcriptional regulator [Thermoanaerobaculia bacterium]